MKFEIQASRLRSAGNLKLTIKSGEISMHKITSRSLLGSILLFGLLVSGGAQAGDDACPVGTLDGSDATTTLDLEFGPGTSDLTTCLSNREDIKIVMQLNK